MRPMILIVGLGNPGAKYARNRHNAGFQAIATMIDAHHLSPERSKHNALVADGMIGGQKVITLRPQTYYNESGNAVSAAARFHKIDVDNIIVFHDEIDLAPGKIRVKKGGGLAGNNGLRSTSAHLGPDFWRVRIGVGHPGRKDAVMPHVLGDFSKAEREGWFEELCERMATSLPLLLPPNEDSSNKFMSAVSNPPSARPAARPNTPAPKPPKAAKPAPSPPAEAEKPSSPFADILKALKPKDD